MQMRLITECTYSKVEEISSNRDICGSFVLIMAAVTDQMMEKSILTEQISRSAVQSSADRGGQLTVVIRAKN